MFDFLRARTLLRLDRGYRLMAALAMPDLALVAGREGKTRYARLPGIVWHRHGKTSQLAPRGVLWSAAAWVDGGKSAAAILISDLERSPQRKSVSVQVQSGASWRTVLTRECLSDDGGRMTLQAHRGVWYLGALGHLLRIDGSGVVSELPSSRAVYPCEDDRLSYEGTSIVCRIDRQPRWSWLPGPRTHVEAVVHARSGGLIAVVAPLPSRDDEPQRLLVRIDPESGRELARGAVVGARGARSVGDGKHLVGRERDGALHVVDLDTFSSIPVAARVGEPLLAWGADLGWFAGGEGRAAWIEGRSVRTWSASEGVVERATLGRSLLGAPREAAALFLAAGHVVWVEGSRVRAVALPRPPIARDWSTMWQRPTTLAPWRERWEFAAIPPELRGVLEALRDGHAELAATRAAAAPAIWRALLDDEVSTLATASSSLATAVRAARAEQRGWGDKCCDRCGRATLLPLDSEVLTGNLSTGASDCEVRWSYRCSSCGDETTHVH